MQAVFQVNSVGVTAFHVQLEAEGPHPERVARPGPGAQPHVTAAAPPGPHASVLGPADALIVWPALTTCGDSDIGAQRD